MKAPFGWTVIRNTAKTDSLNEEDFKVYKRDCPADAANFAEDLAPFTHPSCAAAIAAGKRGEYAYKRA